MVQFYSLSTSIKDTDDEIKLTNFKTSSFSALFLSSEEKGDKEKVRRAGKEEVEEEREKRENERTAYYSK